MSRLVGPLVLIATWSFLQPTLTAGVCGRLAGDDPLPTDASFIFVGTVADTAAQEQNALIHVEEVWRGGPLPEWLPVIGTDDRNLLWEDQTQFTRGERYLVVAYDRAPWFALADVATQRPIPRLWQRCGPPHLRVHLPCLAQSCGSLGQSHGWGRGSLLLACWSGSSLSSVRGFGDALRNPAEH